MFIFLFMTDLFITNTIDRPCIRPPYISPPPPPQAHQKRLQKNISPGLIVRGLQYYISHILTIKELLAYQ